jgi:hypothetical protein
MPNTNLEEELVGLVVWVELVVLVEVMEVKGVMEGVMEAKGVMEGVMEMAVLQA